MIWHWPENEVDAIVVTGETALLEPHGRWAPCQHYIGLVQLMVSALSVAAGSAGPAVFPTLLQWSGPCMTRPVRSRAALERSRQFPLSCQ